MNDYDLFYAISCSLHSTIHCRIVLWTVLPLVIFSDQVANTDFTTLTQECRFSLECPSPERSQQSSTKTW